MTSDSNQGNPATHSHPESDSDLPSCYTDPESVDAWRHRRMLNTVLPLVRLFPTATWMTLGDGRYGSDASFLRAHGVSVMATNVTDTSLRRASEMGFIDQFRSENAESISAEDDSYDFVLCKESYHHFRRPSIAFYEMLRVAHKGVVLIEPIDGTPRVLDIMKSAIKKLLRGDRSVLFEPSGNYLFRVNIPELKKILTALGWSCVAIRRFNDFYFPRVAHHQTRALSPGFLATRAGILSQDLLCYLRLLNFGLATIIVIKGDVSSPIRHALRNDGFSVIALPSNPYL